jgi:hypothetical protein
MDVDDRIRLDYEQTNQLLRTLVDVRFKLLAFVPTIAAFAVGFFGTPRPAAELLAVGLLGLVATLGIFVYEPRNSQLADSLVRRAKDLEQRLGLPSALSPEGPGGLFTERPAPTRMLMGRLVVAHIRGLALVYAAAVSGWGYLVAWGALAAVGFDEARNAAVVIGAGLGLLVVAEVERADRQVKQG